MAGIVSIRYLLLENRCTGDGWQNTGILKTAMWRLVVFGKSNSLEGLGKNGCVGEEGAGGEEVRV